MKDFRYNRLELNNWYRHVPFPSYKKLGDCNVMDCGCIIELLLYSNQQVIWDCPDHSEEDYYKGQNF